MKLGARAVVGGAEVSGRAHRGLFHLPLPKRQSMASLESLDDAVERQTSCEPGDQGTTANEYFVGGRFNSTSSGRSPHGSTGARSSGTRGGAVGAALGSVAPYVLVGAPGSVGRSPAPGTAYRFQLPP